MTTISCFLLGRAYHEPTSLRQTSIIIRTMATDLRKSMSETAARRPSAVSDLPTTASSRRGSGNLTLASGQTIAVHTRTHGEDEVHHADQKTISEQLRKYEALFNLSAPRLRMIVSAFEDALHLGLEKPGQVVASQTALLYLRYVI